MPVAGYNPYAPLALRLPASYVGTKDNRVDRLIQTSPKEGERGNPLDNPLYRKVDVWMLAILYAVAKNLAVSESGDGLERFVDGTVLQSDPDRIALLEMLAICYQSRISSGNPEKIVRDVISDPRNVIDIANRYAAAGIEEVLRIADPSQGKPLWQLTDTYYELGVDSVGVPLQDSSFFEEIPEA